MPIDRLVAPLLRVPAFAGLKPLQITEIARQAERCRFAAGDTIARTGEAADGAYVIAAGLAECLAEPWSGTTELIEPGWLIGEMAMLVEHTWRATVIARERVLCLKITRAAIHAQMLDDTSLALHFQGRIADRLEQVASDLHRIDNSLAACSTAEVQPTPEPAASA
jgi:CRP-like cAMP-binding protein